jgi:hypothetical protein
VRKHKAQRQRAEGLTEDVHQRRVVLGAHLAGGRGGGGKAEMP